MEFERIADKKRLDFIVASIRNQIPPGGEILDIGCGNGIITRAIGTLGYQVLGMDISEKTIQQATADNNLPNVHFKVSAPGEWKTESVKYDAVICSEVLEHLERPEELLKIIHRSLKNEGLLVVTVPNGIGPRELLVTRPVQYLQRNSGWLWKRLSKIKSSMGYTGVTVQSSADDLFHIWFFTQKSLVQLATLTGFTIETIKPFQFYRAGFSFSLVMRKNRSLQKWMRGCRYPAAGFYERVYEYLEKKEGHRKIKPFPPALSRF